MDEKERRHIDLFTGLAGFSLAAQANGVRTVVQCESEAFLRAGLAKAWGVPICPDVRQFIGNQYRGAWLLTAGTPCQPASRAGKQGGASDDRWLWPETLRITAGALPTWALYENPPGIDDVGLGGIITEVARLGYEVGVCRIPACAVNSPQDRDRFWIVAHSKRDEREPRGTRGVEREIEGRIENEHVAHRSAPGLSIGELRPGLPSEARQRSAGKAAGVGTKSGAVADGAISRQARSNQSRQPAEVEEQQWGGVRESKRTLGRVLSAWSDFVWVPMPARDCAVEVRRAPTGLYELANGLPSRLPKGVGSRLIAALGNAICWPVAAEIIKAMIESENQNKL